MKIKAIILAAGYGRRLDPLTGKFPKPLLPIGGRPILDIAAERLFHAGVEKIAVNACHRKEQIRAHLETASWGERAVYFPEEEILGTGGPLVNAREFLSDSDVFLLHNGDIVTDFPMESLLKRHLESGAAATLAVTDAHENRVLTDGKNIFDILGKTGAVRPEAHLRTYACMAAFSPRFLRYLPETPRFCSLIDGVLALLAAEPDAVAAVEIPTSCFWNDVGTFRQYFDTNRAILKENALPSFDADRPFHLRGCSVARTASLHGFIAASPGSSIRAGADVTDCILLPGAEVAEKEFRSNEIIGPDHFSVHADHSFFISLPQLKGVGSDLRITSLAEQGSNRKFYRLYSRATKKTSVLMRSFPEDADFDRFIDYGKFLRPHGLPVPEIGSVDPERRTVLMEDLGDDTLLRILEREPGRWEECYRSVISAAVRFQTLGTKLFLSAGAPPIRSFDVEYLRWETSYFYERFLCKLCRIPISGEEERMLMGEFQTLAEICASMPQTLLHRDFQSQNILIHEGEVRFVDYQGARLGPYTYDAAALLRDPYHFLSGERRAGLYEFYRNSLIEAGFEFDHSHFAKDAEAGALQRAMQCLGAYGFLSLVKKKTKYLAFAEPGLVSLTELLSAGENVPCPMPVLKKLCARAGNVLHSAIRRAEREAACPEKSC